jgi:hypothetical protein
VRAYRRAADTIADLSESARDILKRQGLEGLMGLPTIGESIGAAVATMARTGQWPMLDRLRGELDGEAVFRALPGVGPGLAKRIHDELHIDTLEALETAAHDGRLDSIKGLGGRRIEALKAVLHEKLGRLWARPFPAAGSAVTEPPAEAILAVDALYRTEAATGRLKTIAPRRFNLEGKAWLPILHTQRGDWHYTVLYSNTARAHDLGRVGDWVVVYFYDSDHREGQRTVVTETRGPLAGQRVVRGREAECRGYYAQGAQRPAAAKPAAKTAG